MCSGGGLGAGDVARCHVASLPAPPVSPLSQPPVYGEAAE